MSDISTKWIVTSEGRKISFTSEEKLNAYINSTRPANDESFSVEKITTEKYTIASKFDKAVVDKQLLLDTIHYLGEKLKTNTHINFINYDGVEYDLEFYNITNFQKYMANILTNATLDDIDKRFVFNKCDYYLCNNYMMFFEDNTYKDKEQLFDIFNYPDIGERMNAVKTYNHDHIALKFGIQFRQENNDIIFSPYYHMEHGHHVNCISTKEIPFGETEKTKLINFIDRLFNNKKEV